MVNQQLLDYIKGQRQAGVEDEAIKLALLQAGWADEDITEAMVQISDVKDQTAGRSTGISKKLKNSARAFRAASILLFIGWLLNTLMVGNFWRLAEKENSWSLYVLAVSSVVGPILVIAVYNILAVGLRRAETWSRGLGWFILSLSMVYFVVLELMVGLDDWFEVDPIGLGVKLTFSFLVLMGLLYYFVKARGLLVKVEQSGSVLSKLGYVLIILFLVVVVVKGAAMAFFDSGKLTEQRHERVYEGLCSLEINCGESVIDESGNEIWKYLDREFGSKESCLDYCVDRKLDEGIAVERNDQEMERGESYESEDESVPVIKRSQDFDRLTFEFHDILEFGNRVGNWEVQEAGPFSEGLTGMEAGEMDESDFLVNFTGKEVITGVMFRREDDGNIYLSSIDTVCFDPDDESHGRLPRLDFDDSRNDFCFSNQDKAKQYIELGQELVAEVTISSYNYFRYPTGGIPYIANLESVEALYQDWEEK